MDALDPVALNGARPAATVIIARDGKSGLEVLVIERAKAMGFAGGAIAFPGGKVDPSDRLLGPACEGFAGLDGDESAARLAACREAFEEANLLLSRGPPVPAAERARLRPLSDGHAIAFADLLAGIGHRLDAATLTRFARWLPPEGLHVRFDTRFYLARLPDGERHAADGHEAVACRWARPADLLGEADAGAISLLFPTRCNIARLAMFDTVDALMEDATPAPFVQPTISDGWLSIPEGLGYPWVRERLSQVRRA